MPEQDLALEIKEALEIDAENIMEELRRHSAKYFYYGVLWARAARKARQMHLQTKATEARLTNELRASGQKVTAEMKADYINSHPDYLVIAEQEVQAQYMEDVLSVARDGMRQRGNALQELARSNRQESLYGDEFKAMKNEYEERVADVPKKRKRKVEVDDAN